MADAVQAETTSESTEVVLKGLSVELQSSSNATEAETHISLNGFKTHLEAEEVIESSPQQLEMAETEPTVEGVALQSDYKGEPQERAVEGRHEEGKRYSLLQADDVGIEGRASEGEMARLEQSEGAKEDSRKKDEVEKRYSVLTHDDVDIQGIGLQSQLQEKSDNADVVQQLEEEENTQQEEERIATRPISILSPEEPNVEGVAIESEIGEDKGKPESSQLDEEVREVSNMDEAKEKRYSVLTDDDVDIHGVGLQSQAGLRYGETMDQIVTSHPDENETKQQVEDEDSTKRISLLAPEEPNVEGVAVESEVQEGEGKTETEPILIGEESKYESNKDETEEKRYSVLDKDDVDIHGIGLQSQVLEASEDLASFSDEDKEKQGEDEYNTKRISLLAPEEPNMEGVAVESEVQKDEGKTEAEPPQIDESKELSEVIREGLDETKVEVVVEGNVPSSEGPPEGTETAILDSSEEGAGDEKSETEVQSTNEMVLVSNVEVNERKIIITQEDQIETDEETKQEQNLETGTESEKRPRELSVSDEPPPQKRAKEELQEEGKKPVDEVMEIGKKPDERQLNEILAHVTEIEFEESTQNQMLPVMDDAVEEEDVETVNNEEQKTLNSSKSQYIEELLEEIIGVTNVPEKRISQYIYKIEASDWEKEHSIADNLPTEKQIESCSTEESSSLENTAVEITTKPAQDEHTFNSSKPQHIEEPLEEIIGVTNVPEKRISQYIYKIEASDWEKEHSIADNLPTEKQIESCSTEESSSLENTAVEITTKPAQDEHTFNSSKPQHIEEPLEEIIGVTNVPEKRISQYIYKIEASDWEKEHSIADNLPTEKQIDESCSTEESTSLENTAVEITTKPAQDENTLNSNEPQHIEEPLEEIIGVTNVPEKRISQYIYKIEASDWAEEHTTDDNLPTEKQIDESCSAEECASLENTAVEITTKPAQDPVEEIFEFTMKPEQRLSQYINVIESAEYMPTDPPLIVSENTKAEKDLVPEEMPLDHSSPEEASVNESTDEDKENIKETAETTEKPEQRLSGYLMAGNNEPLEVIGKNSHADDVTVKVAAFSTLEFSPEISRPPANVEVEAGKAGNKDQESVEQILSVIDTLPDDAQTTEPQAVTEGSDVVNGNIIVPSVKEDTSSCPIAETPPSNLPKQRHSLEETEVFTNQSEKTADEIQRTGEIGFEESIADERVSKPLDDFELESENDVKMGLQIKIEEEPLEADSQAEHKVEDIVKFFEEITHETPEDQDHFKLHESKRTCEMDYVPDESQAKTESTERSTISSTTSVVLAPTSWQKDEKQDNEVTVPVLIKQTQEVEQSWSESEITVVSQTMQEESATLALFTNPAEATKEKTHQEIDGMDNIFTGSGTEGQPESNEPVEKITNACEERSYAVLEYSEQQESENFEKSVTTSEINGNNQELSSEINEQPMDDISMSAIVEERGETCEASQHFNQPETYNQELTSFDMKQEKTELDVDTQDEETKYLKNENQKSSKLEEETHWAAKKEKDDEVVISQTRQEESTTALLSEVTTQDSTFDSIMTTTPAIETKVMLTTPVTEAIATTPATEATAVTPTAEAKVTTPTTEAIATTPATEAIVTTPTTEAIATTPSTEAIVTIPATEAITTTTTTPATEVTTTTVVKKTVVLQKSKEQTAGKSKTKTASPEIRLTSATPTPAELDQIKEEEHPGIAPLASKEEDTFEDETKLIKDENKKKKPTEEKEPEIETKPETSTKNTGGGDNDDGDPLVAKESHKKKCCTIL